MTQRDDEAPSRWATRVVTLLASGPTVGVLLGVAGFVLGTLSLENLSYFGQSSAALRELAVRTYGAQVALESARYLAIYVALGLLGGLASEILWALRDRLGSGPPRSWLLRAARHAGLLLGVHGLLLARSIVRYPQLYAESLYDRGGLRAEIQVLLTDWFSPHLLDVLLGGGLLLLTTSPWLLRRGRSLWAHLRDGQRPGRRALFRGGALFGVAAAALGVSALFGRPQPTPENRGPNVLVIAVDSLRADRLEDPRYRRVTPHLRRLAARSVRFRRAYATLARTFPAWVTLLTGREPHDHGIRHMFPSWEARRRIGPTLPRVLGRSGVATSVLSDYAGEIFGRVDLGFQRVSVPAFSFYEIVRQRVLSAHLHLLPYLATGLGRRLAPPLRGLPVHADPEVLADRLIAELDRLARRPRFFLVGFFSAAHFPYAAPYPYYQRFTNRGYRGPSRYLKQRRLHNERLSREEVDHVRGLYDGAVAAADAAIGRVLAHLARRGLARKTVVVLTADHGENLFEADLGMGHGDHLRGEAGNRVPLLIRDPDLAPRTVEAIVRDVDLAPTLAHRLGARLPGATGVDLAPLMRGAAPPRPRAAFLETGLWFTAEVPGVAPDMRLSYPAVLSGLVTMDAQHQRDLVVAPQYEPRVVAAKHRAIRTDRWKLIYVPRVDGVRYLLYDVRADPLCQRDLARARPEVVRTLSARLLGWMRRAPDSVQVGPWVVPAGGGSR